MVAVGENPGTVKKKSVVVSLKLLLILSQVKHVPTWIKQDLKTFSKNNSCFPLIFAYEYHILFVIVQ